jgi:hypothetical protein
MAVKLEYEDNNLIVIRASDVLKRTESDETKKQVVTFINQQGRINVLIIIEKGFSNLEAFACRDDGHDDEFIQRHVNRIAIVGDLKWRMAPLYFFQNRIPQSSGISAPYLAILNDCVCRCAAPISNNQ